MTMATVSRKLKPSPIVTNVAATAIKNMITRSGVNHFGEFVAVKFNSYVRGANPTVVCCAATSNVTQSTLYYPPR